MSTREFREWAGHSAGRLGVLLVQAFLFYFILAHAKKAAAMRCMKVFGVMVAKYYQ